MTLDQINHARHMAARYFVTNDPKLGQIEHEELDIDRFARQIQQLVMIEVLALARANMVLSDSANELYQDLQAYDRFERGLNF